MDPYERHQKLGILHGGFFVVESIIVTANREVSMGITLKRKSTILWETIWPWKYFGVYFDLNLATPSYWRSSSWPVDGRRLTC